MTDEPDLRRRRAAYRAAHRGTKEMDWLIGRYADAFLTGMSEDDLAHFERLLALPDPELQGLILNPGGVAPTDFAELILALRRFHGLGQGSAGAG